MNFEPKRILIAEDHHVSRHLLERNLMHWGFEVMAAEDGAAAWKILEGANPPGLALLDWNMPKMDGLEVCRRVRARVGQPFTYLMLLTARNKTEALDEVRDAGVDEYIIKPFDSDELRLRLKVARRVVALERALAAQGRELADAKAELQKLRGQAPADSAQPS